MVPPATAPSDNLPATIPPSARTKFRFQKRKNPVVGCEIYINNIRAHHTVSAS